jgi:uncharacterized protein YndB with AHSA1/START domain
MTADAIAPVRKSINVDAPIEHAFDVFTSGLTRWWPPNRGLGKKPIRKVLLEPGLGGRWLSISEDGTETVVATISAWEPPHRFVMLWHMTGQFLADVTIQSQVEVCFVAVGAHATRVDLVHDEFENLGAHDGAIVRGAVNDGWPGMLERYAREAERPAPEFFGLYGAKGE